MQSNITKKAHARLVACIAEGHKDGGVSSKDIVLSLKRFFNKTATERTVETILSDPFLALFVYQDKQTGLYLCTERGLDEYKVIKNNKPHLLEKTSTPDIPLMS